MAAAAYQVFFCLILLISPISASDQPRVSILLTELGALPEQEPFVKYAPPLTESQKTALAAHKQKTLAEIDGAKTAEVRETLLGNLFHGHFVGRELLENIDPAKITLKVDPNILPALEVSPPYSRKQLQEIAKLIVDYWEKTITSTEPVPELVISSLDPPFRGVTSIDREFERDLYEKNFSELFARFPRTLFVLTAGNDSCDISKTEFTFGWSRIKLPNVAICGSCNAEGKPSNFSNYGDGVNMNFSGENIKISRAEIAGDDGKPNEIFTVNGTSFATPRMGRYFLNERIANLSKFPNKRVIEYYWDYVEEQKSGMPPGRKPPVHN